MKKILLLLLLFPILCHSQNSTYFKRQHYTDAFGQPLTSGTQVFCSDSNSWYTLTQPSDMVAHTSLATTSHIKTPSGGSGGSGWSLTGNSGTTAGTNFIGTTDSVGLSIKSFSNHLSPNNSYLNFLPNGQFGFTARRKRDPYFFMEMII